MNLRKQRVIQSGLTNVDFKTKGDMAATDKYNPTLKFADVGTMNKSNFKALASSMSVDPKETLKLNSGWQVAKMPDPKSDTAV